MNYREDTLEWLELRSDTNLLRQYQNNLDDLPDSRKRDLLDKGYLWRSNPDRKLHLTKKGRDLLENEEEPPYH